MERVYVDMLVSYRADGSMAPRAFLWEDGSVCRISDSKLDRYYYEMKDSSKGDRYIITVDGQKSYAYFERSFSITGNNIGRWFVER